MSYPENIVPIVWVGTNIERLAKMFDDIDNAKRELDRANGIVKEHLRQITRDPARGGGDGND
jgi:hypothetical protein